MNQADYEIESDYEESTMNVIIHEPVPKAKPGVNNYRLGGRPPLKTIGSLIVGPVMNQLCGALYGIICSMFVSMALGNTAVSAISNYSTFDLIGRAFGFFLSVAASTKVSQLFGKGLHEEAGQVVCDLVRMAFVFGAIVPAIVLPVCNICCRWFGAGDEVVDLGFKYLCPIIACSVFTCIYYLCNGILQGEGRTLLVGIVSVVSLCAAMFLFETLFLFVFHTGIIGAGFATVIGDAVPGVVLIVLYFTGRFTIKPNWRGLFRKFSHHTGPALKVGISQLVSNLSLSLPGIAIRKLIGASVTQEEYNDCFAGFTVIYRYSYITNCINIAVAMGYIPAASYAYASHQYKRFLKLTLYSSLIAFAWSALTNIISWGIPREISKIFGSGESFLYWGSHMLQYGNGVGCIQFFRIISQGCLQALQLGGQAMFITLTSQLLAIIGFAFLLYYTDRHNAIRIMWTYPLSYAFGLILGTIVLIKPFRKLWRLYKEEEMNKTSIRPIDQKDQLSKGDSKESQLSSSSKSSRLSNSSSDETSKSHVKSTDDKECENIVEI